jgi:hypothetical protein
LGSMSLSSAGFRGKVRSKDICDAGVLATIARYETTIKWLWPQANAGWGEIGSGWRWQGHPTLASFDLLTLGLPRARVVQLAGVGHAQPSRRSTRWHCGCPAPASFDTLPLSSRPSTSRHRVVFQRSLASLSWCFVQGC